MTKRPRSPPSPSPTSPSALDARPSKRLAFGVNTSVSVPIGSLSGHHPHHYAPGIQTRQVSEDWVRQTRGLRIDRDEKSPLVEQQPTSQFLGTPTIVEEPSSSGKDEGMDVGMAIDHDEPMSIAPPPPNSPANMSMSTQTNLMIPSNDAFELSSQYQLQQQQQQFFQNTASSSSSSSLSSNFLDPNQYQVPFASNTNSPSPSPTPAPIAQQNNEGYSNMPISQEQAQSQPTQSQPTRKPQRFTMGPRADCEKCRLGVKGHWMHFD
ncbi:hypothetical protein C8Q75DRAFT_804604 [Abortiporus biennis]|nr:hypothetical protein C8Q75DRAFT_804604 [Abortiporus biennis]